jgi:lysozyme family protein
MQNSEAAVMARVFAHEGGYANHPKDPGGPTNWGITITDARLYGKEFGCLKTWPDFGNGWDRRVSEVREFGLQLASQSAVAPSQPGHVPGKGHVPPPTGTKTVIKVGAGGSAAYGARFLDWVATHPVETGLVVVGGVVIVAGALHLANRWHQSKQEAPVPGIRPVPAIA